MSTGVTEKADYLWTCTLCNARAVAQVICPPSNTDGFCLCVDCARAVADELIALAANRPVITSALKKRFIEYGIGTCWRSLHITMDDGNIDNHHVEFCLKDALAKGDTEGAALAEILLKMSKTQRRKLRRVCDV